MFDLKSLVQVIQKAVDTALHSVSQGNLDLLRTYFKPADGAASVTSDGVQGSTNSSASGSAPGFGAFEGEVLEPRTYRMRFLKDTAKGPVPHEVTVPVLSLVPYSSLQPTEITLEIDLECVEKDGEMMVAFPQVKKRWIGGETMTDTTPNAKLTLKINAGSRPAGISAIIEGYDKILRAQIPN